jgi:methionine biosynthesis protein MetW
MPVLNKAKHWLRDLFRYPTIRPVDGSYDEYWSSRDMSRLNSFQKKRADYLVSVASDGTSVLDVGCGDGRILEYMQRARPDLKLSGIDGSPAALNIAKKRGLNVERADLRDIASLGEHGADYIVLFEVLEHMADSESLLGWAVSNARRAVIFSVPNTGFIMHRLRLLLGRFPLQWRAHPSEHLRFWTMTDMRRWVAGMGYNCDVIGYEGVPTLNGIWPSLFAEGQIVLLTLNGE